MSSTLGSVHNALQILHLLRQRGPMRVSEIADILGVAVSTAHRLVATLREERFVRQEKVGRRYELGPAMLYTAPPSAINHAAAASVEVMRRLRDLVGETVHLSVLRGPDCVFATCAESEQLIRVTSRVGQHPPAHTTAAGKVLLAALNDARLAELLPTDALPTPTPHALPTVDLLRAELSQVRNVGWARNLGESESDMYAIAVPLESPDGHTVASLSLAAPLSRVRHATASGELAPAEQGYLDALRAATGAISRRLAF